MPVQSEGELSGTHSLWHRHLRLERDAERVEWDRARSCKAELHSSRPGRVAGSSITPERERPEDPDAHGVDRHAQHRVDAGDRRQLHYKITPRHRPLDRRRIEDAPLTHTVKRECDTPPRCCIELLLKLSKITTPLAPSSRFVRAVLMKSAPPVTKTRLSWIMSEIRSVPREAAEGRTPASSQGRPDRRECNSRSLPVADRTSITAAPRTRRKRPSK